MLLRIPALLLLVIFIIFIVIMLILAIGAGIFKAKEKDIVSMPPENHEDQPKT